MTVKKLTVLCLENSSEHTLRDMGEVTRFFYTHEQGLVKRRLKFEEQFHPSTLKLEEYMG
jgi:hypothetical protein